MTWKSASELMTICDSWTINVVQSSKIEKTHWLMIEMQDTIGNKSGIFVLNEERHVNEKFVVWFKKIRPRYEYAVQIKYIIHPKNK